MPEKEDGYLLIDDGTTKKISTTTVRGTVVNNLTETTAGKQLDARQGRVLNNLNTDNVAALIAVNAVYDSELEGEHSPQRMRKPASDTYSKIPANASDMLWIANYQWSNGNGYTVYTRWYNPALGTQVLHIGGDYNGSQGSRVTGNVVPGSTNSSVTGKTSVSSTMSLVNDGGRNYFRIYDPNAEE